MACLDNVQIAQTVSYATTPNTIEGYISGSILVEILNIGASSVTGTITVDKVRDTMGDILDPAVEQIDNITSDSQTFNYNFYYPINEPESITINVAVDIRVDDCLYSSQCNHVLLAPNLGEEQSSCNIATLGVPVVTGCTNPLYYEYNPNANVDDGSCANLIPVLGCTNPLATNYNSNATQNDGSCVFPSGCTNSLANNYDSLALIDDGSCECGDINLQLDFFNSTGESFVLSGDCDYFIEFDLITKIDCEKFLAYFERDDRTILEILNSLKINNQIHALLDDNGDLYEYSGGTVMISGTPDFSLVQNETIFEFDIDNNPIGIGLVDNNGSCDTFFDLIALELGLECQTFDKSKFDVNWEHFKIGINRDLLGSFTKFILNYENFRFGICTYVDNLKVSSVCNDNFEKCILIPSVFGFELEKVIDNKKSWVNSGGKTQRVFNQIESRETDYIEFDPRLIFNSKELELQINPVKYIQSDVIEYYDYYKRFYKDIDQRFEDVTLEKIKYEYIDVTNRQTIRGYSYLPTVYERYLDELDCAPSKGLDYGYGLDIISKVGKFWFSLIKNLVPATSIWNENEYILKNNVFHLPKHIYKKYSLTNGSGGDSCAPSGVTIVCEKMSADCFASEVDNIDQLLMSENSNVDCVNSGDTVCFTDFIGDGSFSGKLIQYKETTGDTVEIIQYIGFDDYDCISGATGETPEILGCTNPFAINYNPNATVDDGSCIYEELFLTGSAICISGNTAQQIFLVASGGAPPYTFVGLQNGEILATGESYSVYATDSVGNISNTITGFTECPVSGCTEVEIGLDASYNCIIDEFGYSTMTATLNLMATGGTTPYSFVDFNTMNPVNDGDVVNDGDILDIIVTDNNGCQSDSVEITIDCPEVTCEEISLPISIIIETLNNITPTTSDMRINWDVSGIPTYTGLSNLNLSILAFGGYSTTPFVPHVINSTNLVDSGDFTILYIPDSPTTTVINVVATATLDNGCILSRSIGFFTLDGSIVGDDFRINTSLV